MYDIKCFSRKKHINATGHSNDIILQNLKNIVNMNMNTIWVRIPVIKNFNDNLFEIKAIARFLRDYAPVSKIELLLFHAYGINKYESLGMEYTLSGNNTPNHKKTDMLNKVFKPMENIK